MFFKKWTNKVFLLGFLDYSNILEIRPAETFSRLGVCVYVCFGTNHKLDPLHGDTTKKFLIGWCEPWGVKETYLARKCCLGGNSRKNHNWEGQPVLWVGHYIQEFSQYVWGQSPGRSVHAGKGSQQVGLNRQDIGPGWHMERKSKIIYSGIGFSSHGSSLRAGIQPTEGRGYWAVTSFWSKGHIRTFDPNY